MVAIDAGADEVFSYGSVRAEQVRDLVHGAIFTRGPKDLKSTAIFIGGSDVAAGERLLEEVRRHMLPQFGLRVSVLLDANGANTTAYTVNPEHAGALAQQCIYVEQGRSSKIGSAPRPLFEQMKRDAAAKKL